MSQTGHFRPIDNVYAMSAYPPTAVELSQRSEPPLRADFVAEVGFEGRVGRPEDILGRGEAIVLRQPRDEREL